MNTHVSFETAKLASTRTFRFPSIDRPRWETWVVDDRGRLLLALEKTYMSSIRKCPECHREICEFEYVCRHCRRIFLGGILQMCFFFAIAVAIFGGAIAFGIYQQQSGAVYEIVTGRAARFAIFMAICGFAIMFTIVRERFFRSSDDKTVAHTPATSETGNRTRPTRGSVQSTDSK